jgi:hypothetical protein
MKKKYLKTIEDIEALRNTNTKIYSSLDESKPETFYRFVNGVPCFFWDENNYSYNVFLQSNENARLYIIVEEPVKDANENDIGKLCWFWDGDNGRKFFSTLLNIDTDNLYSFCCRDGCYEHCRRLTPAEVAEITGYKVEE